MAEASRALDSFRCRSREGTPCRGAYGASISIREDQAWTAQTSAACRRASLTAQRRAAVELGEPLTPTTIRTIRPSVPTTNLQHLNLGQLAHGQAQTHTGRQVTKA
jgi:hypothetical protein